MPRGQMVRSIDSPWGVVDDDDPTSKLQLQTWMQADVQDWYNELTSCLFDCLEFKVVPTAEFVREYSEIIPPVYDEFAALLRQVADLAERFRDSPPERFDSDDEG